MTALVDHPVNPFENGSNGVAIGRELSVTGKGILYTNPTWIGAIDFRMYPRHHIIPGVLNELGRTPLNAPNVGFGTNGDIAWTNTVSTSTGLTFYKLDLVSGDPMSYLFDGEIRKIEPLDVTVRVRGADGSLSDARHTFYFSHFGPMTGASSLVAQPGLLPCGSPKRGPRHAGGRRHRHCPFKMCGTSKHR